MLNFGLVRLGSWRYVLNSFQSHEKLITFIIMCADDVCKEGKVDANNMGERMDELYVSDFRGAL